jgi:hypothetical protein
MFRRAAVDVGGQEKENDKQKKRTDSSKGYWSKK